MPCLPTAEKYELEQVGETPVNDFLKEKCFLIQGAVTSMKDLYEAFIGWMPIDRRRPWSTMKFTKNIPAYINTGGDKWDLPRGKYKGANYFIGNLSLNPNTERGIKLIRIFDKLVEEV